MVNVIISIGAITALLALAGVALNRERSRAGVFLCAALAVTALLELLDLRALTTAGDAFSWKRYALIAESFLPPCWILCSLTYARQSGPWKIGRFLKGVVALSFLFSVLPAVFPLSAFFYAPDFPAERLLFLGNTGYFYYLGIMACLVYALVNFETTLANASPEALWKIKFDIIGIGTILAVLIFNYSQAFLYRSLNMNYLPLRSFLYLVAAAMIAYSQFFRRGNVRIQVSRQAAYKSLVLLAMGLYLIMLGLLGEGMQYFGTSFSRSMTISFAFLVGIAILTLFLSERVRREVKVMLHKNFFQQKHDYRTQWLRFTEQLSTSRSGEDLLQCILSAYCDIFGINGAALYLYEEGRGGYCMTAQHEMEPAPAVIAPDNSLINFMKKCAWVVNTREDNPEIMVENALFFSKNQISFIIPLFARERLEGFIALGRVIKMDEVYIYEDYDLMKTIARQASLAILHQRLSEQTTQAREIEVIGNVAAFVAHDLKNLVSNLSLIVENAARYIHNPDFQQDMLASLGNTADKMQRLIGRLNNLGEGEMSCLQQVNLLDLVEKTARLVTGSSIRVSGTPVTALGDENEIQKVVLNLLINGIEASGPDEPVLAEVGTAGAPFIRVTDRGCGISDRFIRTELFKPFRTTKKKGLGIGLYQCRKIVEAHGGRIEVSSAEGSGSVFTVWFADTADMRAEYSA
ncbi:MAG: XrtA/PEP-CTERM system histidine kinase PrsK [Oryzomonas sp.]|jgi:putative PEP-CTERM system histidine kinase